MKLDMPKAVFSGLALIAAAVFFGPGSLPAGASNSVQKVQICNEFGHCANVNFSTLAVRTECARGNLKGCGR